MADENYTPNTAYVAEKPTVAVPACRPRSPFSANVSRTMDDGETLCFNPSISEEELTAYASAPTVHTRAHKLQLEDDNQLSIAASLDLLFPHLPEIPDCCEVPAECGQTLGPNESVLLNTPSSQYHSLEGCPPLQQDHRPPSLFRQYLVSELELTRVPTGISPSPGLSRSLDFDSCSQDTSSLDLGTGLGHGLASPFNPQVSAFGPQEHHILHSHPLELVSPVIAPSPREQCDEISYPLGQRRSDALAAWRPAQPAPLPHRLTYESGLSYAGSLEQPFPSSASIWIVERTPAQSVEPSLDPDVVVSASCPVLRERKWSIEEQITIEVLRAMDRRDRGFQTSGLLLPCLCSSDSCPTISSRRKGILYRLMDKFRRSSSLSDGRGVV
ncbi:unnamed protein product [Mycena citricolor]|uniref:Uncharacterized protein n=1 Tax=Mycena citricolor TaxID=2018698 RepID=A0AAD2GWC4_9AGAR|nr:unnamed protein product [Mycena citricolor]